MTRRLAAAAVFSVGAVALVGAQSAGSGQATQQAQAGTAEVQAARPGRDSGITWPRVVREERPTYTHAGMRSSIQGVVAVDAVVESDGSVGQVTVARSLDKEFGLDEAAVTAARNWRFEPCRLEATNEPVACRITIELEFRMHPTPPAPLMAGSQQSLIEFERGAYREGAEGVMPPRVLEESFPVYTPEAMRRKIQGIVAVDVVVNPDGSVDRARLAGSLDSEFGLDAQAVAAARQWQFEPGSGTLNGVAVPVIVRLRLEFRIH